MNQEPSREFVSIEGGVTAPLGFSANGVSCGLKKGGYKDIGLLVSKVPCDLAVAFTNNTVRAAHILQNLKWVRNKISAIVVNSGNANCLTGRQGLKDAERMAELTCEHLRLPYGSVMIASTGKIGEPLNMDRVSYGIEKVCRNIKTESNYLNFSQAIMTTDTRPKNLAYEFKLGDKKVRIGITAKGAGMIKPDLNVLHATLLVFITTDVAISSALLKSALKEAIDLSFNRISVDNDTSTNDSVFLMSSGLAKNDIIQQENDDYRLFKDVLIQICIEMAKLVIKDGEGANKLLTIDVQNSLTTNDARKVARAVADSYLVKTAVFGQSANWGRIMAAIGYSGAKIDLQKLTLSIEDIVIYDKGESYLSNLSKAEAAMLQHDFTITIDLGLGNKHYNIWTCDLSYEYVKINSQYMT